jgi:hypothetical protein
MWDQDVQDREELKLNYEDHYYFITLNWVSLRDKDTQFFLHLPPLCKLSISSPFISPRPLFLTNNPSPYIIDFRGLILALGASLGVFNPYFASPLSLFRLLFSGVA